MGFERRAKEKFRLVADTQAMIGLTKYGKEVEPMDDYDWLQMAMEESVDGFKYLYAEQVKRNVLVTSVEENLCKLDNLLTEGRVDLARTEIYTILKQLQKLRSGGTGK